MGGHALSQVKTRRYNTDEYMALALKMQMHMLILFEKDINIVRAYHGKQDHGDMDILLKNDGTLGNIADKLNEYFKPGQMVCNGGVYSFDYEEFQIDVILTTPENWDTSVAFFDYDPSGNLMGKIAHKFGLKYGFKGLTYPYRTTEGVEFADITISKDNGKIFEFLGFDYEEFKRGFVTKKDIFDYVVNSKYFDPQNFLMENLNHIDKKRKKRPTYQEFLSYINTEVKDGRKWNQTFSKNKEEYLPMINSAFPDAKLYYEIEKCRAADARRMIIASKFNGETIMKMYPELSGESLGKFIIGFKLHVADLQRAMHLDGENEQLFREYVLNCGTDIISNDIKNYYNSIHNG